MAKKIIRREVADASLTPFAALHPVLARIYAARDVRSMQELDCQFDSLLPYQTLQGLEKAIELLVTAVTTQKNILIVGFSRAQPLLVD